MRNTEVAAKRGRFFTNHGDPDHVLYSSYIDEAGVIQLEKVGSQNTDELIESFRESTELNVILNKYLHGDESALNRYQGFYADLTQLPNNRHELLNTVLKAQNAFEALSPAVKSQFGNDWTRWAMSAGDENWQSAMADYLNNTHANNEFNDNARVNEEIKPADSAPTP